MAHLVYYEKEDSRHPDMLAAGCTQAEAIAAITELFSIRQLPPIPILFHRAKPGRSKSWYQPPAPLHKKKEHIGIEERMLNWLTVAHEFAHYDHYHDYGLRKRAHRRAHDRKNTVLRRWTPYKEPVRERWHGPEHRRITDEVVDLIKSKGWNQRQPSWKPDMKVDVGETRVATIEATPTFQSWMTKNWIQSKTEEILAGKSPESLTAEERRAIALEVGRHFLQTLPDSLHCTKCNLHVPRAKVGIRIMIKDVHGLPTKILRQSYCANCRVKKAK